MVVGWPSKSSVDSAAAQPTSAPLSSSGASGCGRQDADHREPRVPHEHLRAGAGPADAETVVEDVFEPFRRLGADRIAGGAGLGLSIVRAVAIAHGGEATARPRAGGGLVVTVRLPASTYEPEDEPTG